MKIPRAALDLIKEFEGFEAETYRDAVGVYTIGYGTTERAGVGIIPVPGMVISEAQAEKYLLRAVKKMADEIRPKIKKPMTKNEWAAFLSLAYNIGPSAFKHSTLLRRFNEGNKTKAADEFLRWNKAGGKVLRGLTRRRHRERSLFLTPVQSGFFNFLLTLLRSFKWTR